MGEEWVIEPRGKFPDLGSDASSVWNFCGRFSDVIWRGNPSWHREMLAVFSS